MPDIFKGAWCAFTKGLKFSTFTFPLCCHVMREWARLALWFWVSGPAVFYWNSLPALASQLYSDRKKRLGSFQTHRHHTPTYQDCGVPQLSLAPLSWSEIVI
jgi:hypothetical protein